MITRRDADITEIPERRAIRRFDMRLPASIRIRDADGEEWLTETQNVSARGLFFYAREPVQPGTRLEVTLTFPHRLPLPIASAFGSQRGWFASSRPG